MARLLTAAFAAALAIVAIGLVAQAVLVAWFDYIPAPLGDEWDSIALFQRFSAAPSFHLLFSQHNEHRIAFPRLLFWSDYAVLDGTGTVDVAATFVILGLDACLFGWLARRLRPRGTAWLAASACTTALLFSMQQSENFTWAFQTQFVGVFAAASLACAVFARAAEPQARRDRCMLAALGLCVVATFTMANGLLAGPALVAMAVAARLPRRFILWPAILSAALFAAYLSGFERPPGDLPISDPFAYASRVAINGCRYLGLFLEQPPSVQAAFGAAGLAWAAWAWGRALRGGERNPVRLACLGIVAFAAASAALTAVGRSAGAGSDIGASRYLMGTATFWCAMLIHGWSQAADGPAAGRRAGTAALASALLACTAAVVLLASVIGAQEVAVMSARDFAFKRRLVENTLLLGLHDAEANADALEVGDASIAWQLPFLRARGISLFADRDARLIGMPLAAVGRPGAADCGGQLAVLATPSLGDRGVRARGTTPLSSRWPRLVRIYLADRSGRVAGLGTKAPDSEDWRGYALGSPGDRLSAYALSQGGRLCRIGESTVASRS